MLSLIVNAATREKDLHWINMQANAFNVQVSERPELAMIAVQGPNARARVIGLLDKPNQPVVDSLGRFSAVDVQGLFIARTGYTGEDGFEIVVPEAQAVSLWNQLMDAGVKPAGLGARDTLRLEAGMNLYGQDMDDTVSPLEAALAWTLSVSDTRDFIGKSALLALQASGVARQMIGLVLDEKGVLRHGQIVGTAQGQGEILSGTFSPSLGKAIAFARVPAGDLGDIHVDIRGRAVPVRLVTPPFVRDGKACSGI